MTGQTESRHPQAPTDIGASYDPFRAHHPTVLVHDVGLEAFERAWHDSDSRCPQCRRGTPHERGTTDFDQRRWVRFTCGDVIALEQTAG
jgi:hypothetical protein